MEELIIAELKKQRKMINDMRESIGNIHKNVTLVQANLNTLSSFVRQNS